MLSHSSLSKELTQELSKIVGETNVLWSPTDLSVYECDSETLDRRAPDLVVLPGSTHEVQAAVKLAYKYKIPITPRGAGTGLSGGATPVMGGISLVLTRMTRIIQIDRNNLTAWVEAGVTNLAVSQAAAKYNLHFAPDPSSQAASTIGGNLAENAGGAHTLKYGMTTNNVLGAKVVLANGDMAVFGGQAYNCLGLDLLGLFVGSEGTLGIATEAWLRLVPLPKRVETMLAYFPSLVLGGQAVADIIATGIIPAAMEMLDQLTLGCVEDAFNLGLNKLAGSLLIVELDGPEAGIEMDKQGVTQCAHANGALEIIWAKDTLERAAIWKARKLAFASLGRLAPDGYVLDGVIPPSQLPSAIAKIQEISEKYSTTIANVYHAGDGNLHPCLLYHRANEDEVQRVLQAAHEILLLCVNLGGTLSGEHGIGIEKLNEMAIACSPKDLQALLWVRQAFNPDNVLNPGKVIPSFKSCGEPGIRKLRRAGISAIS